LCGALLNFDAHLIRHHQYAEVVRLKGAYSNPRAAADIRIAGCSQYPIGFLQLPGGDISRAVICCSVPCLKNARTVTLR